MFSADMRSGNSTSICFRNFLAFISFGAVLHGLKQWYFVTKIVLTYREKKIVLVIEKNFYFWAIFRNYDHSASRVGRWDFSFWQKKGWKWICRNYGQAVPKSWKNICILQWSRKSKKNPKERNTLLHRVCWREVYLPVHRIFSMVTLKMAILPHLYIL